MAGYNGFNIPNITEIRNRVFADIENQLPGSNANLRYSPLNVLGESLVGATYELYGYLQWVAKQTNVLWAEDTNLDLWGSHWGVQRKPASYATGVVRFTGVNGSTIPAGTLIQSDNSQYITDNVATIAAGIADVAVSSTSAGTAANKTNGIQLSLVNPVAGVDSSIVVQSITGGEDIEQDDVYRTRIRDRIVLAPQGGCANDYVVWAKQVPGITRAWAYPEELGRGTITLRFMMDNSYPNGIPQPSDITNVYNYIYPLKPATAELSVVAPIEYPVDITINGLYPDTPTTRANAVAELQAMFRQQSEPGNDIRISWIWEAVTLATGTQYHTITTPSADISVATGQLPILGNVNFT